jgi:CHAT domain-containing protein
MLASLCVWVSTLCLVGGEAFAAANQIPVAQAETDARCEPASTLARRAAQLYESGSTALALEQHRGALAALSAFPPELVVECAFSLEWAFDIAGNNYPAFIADYSATAFPAALKLGLRETAARHLGQLAVFHWDRNDFAKSMSRFREFGEFADPFTTPRPGTSREELIRQTLVFKDLLRRYVRFMFNTYASVHRPLCTKNRCLDLAWEMQEKIKGRLFRTDLLSGAVARLRGDQLESVRQALGEERDANFRLAYSRVRGGDADAKAALDLARSRLSKLLPESTTFFGRTVTQPQVLSVLAKGEAIVSYFYTDNERPVYATVITNGRSAEPIRLPVTTAQLYFSVARLRGDIEKGRGLVELTPQLEMLSTWLIAPLKLSGTVRLVVAADQNLASLPFELLPWQKDMRLMDALSVTYVPSATVFYQQRTSARAPDSYSREYVGISSSGDAGAVLRYAASEVQTSSSHFKDPVIVSDATEGDVYSHRRELATARYLHLVSHNHASLELDGSFYLGFRAANEEDGRLTGAEIVARLQNRASLVVLSACQTALPNDEKFLGIGVAIDPGLGGRNVYTSSGCICTFGESFSDLAGAFFAAGSRRLLLTQWLLPDARTTEEFVSSFFRQIAAGIPLDIALRASKRAMLNRPPLFWAGFILVGD